MSDHFHLVVPDSLVDQIVEQAIERIRDEFSVASPWLNRKAAAAYLDVPVSRLEKDRMVPSHRWDGRVFYNRTELDEWLVAQ